MNATQQLRNEHEGINVMLDVLEHLAAELRQGHPVELEHLDGIVDFLRTFADTCHHGKEEEFLFPALVAIGLPADGGPIGVMLAEHAQGRNHIRGMVDALAQLHAGADTANQFAQHALGYVALLRAHIQKENQILFVIAEQRLPAGEDERLTAAFERIETERIGEGVHEKYHAMIHALQQEYLKKAA